MERGVRTGLLNEIEGVKNGTGVMGGVNLFSGVLQTSPRPTPVPSRKEKVNKRLMKSEPGRSFLGSESRPSPTPLHGRLNLHIYLT